MELDVWGGGGGVEMAGSGTRSGEGSHNSGLVVNSDPS